MAILIVALTATLAASLAWEGNIWARRMENSEDRTDAFWLAAAATNFAAAVLNDDARHGNVDYLGEAWASELPPMPVDNGQITGSILDQQGLFNLNDLAVDGKTDMIRLAQFRNLLMLLNLPPDLADALADWIDADNAVQPPGGAENAYYLGLPDPYRAANMPLNEIGDLSQIKGFDEATIAILRPFVTALPSYTPINVNTAPPEVLSSVLEGLTLAEARAIVERRNRHYFADVADFKSAAPDLVIHDNEIEVASQYFLVTGVATQGKSKVTMQTLLDREGAAWPVRIWQKS